MHYVRVFIICIYLEPKTKLPGLTGSFLLTQASFGSAFKLLIHRIYSFAVDVSGVAALWQIKSCKNLHFQWKSRMCQAWCSTRSFFFFFPSCCCFACPCFCYPVSEAPCSGESRGVPGKHGLWKMFSVPAPHTQPKLSSAEMQLYLKLSPTNVFGWNQPVMLVF